MDGKAERIAKQFHDVYERIAPDFGYTTRRETRAWDASSANGRLTLAVVSEVVMPQLAERDAQIATVRSEWTKGREQRDARIDELYQETVHQGAQIAEMRKVLGPECPECGRWLRVEHLRSLDGYLDGRIIFVDGYYRRGERLNLCFSVHELRSLHPGIAAELGLTEANDGK